MAYDLEEQEKLDELKAWWKRNGTTVLLSVFVFFAVLAGVQGYRHYQKTQRMEAAMVYETLEGAELPRLREVSGHLMERYSGTPYAARAALLAASANYAANDLKSAASQLEWAIEHTAEDSVRDIARLRLATILLNGKRYAEAMKQLDAKHEKAFSGLFSDLKGDVLMAEGKVLEARVAYREAMGSMEEKSAYRQVVQMKLDGLGGEK